MSQNRYVDEGVWIGSFLAKVYVHCPRCNACAAYLEEPSRTVCKSCGYAGTGGFSGYGDAGFGGTLNLWLQTPCCGEILWAFNENTFLEDYVSADIRTRQYPVTERGWSNSSLASRLPKWMIASHNREDVMKGLAVLRRKLSPD